MTKRILTILLAVAMVACAFPITVFATTTESTPTPYSATDEKAADLEIATKDQLLTFAENVKNGETYAGKKVQLTADIDLAGLDWPMIGTYGKPFSGEFDGNGKTIFNLTDSTANDHKGLFAHLNNAYVHDLTLKDVKFSGTCEGDLYAGALVAEAESKNLIKNVNVDGITWDITSARNSIGSIAGYSYDTNYIDCTVKEATFKVVSTDHVKMGGMVGQGRGVGTFTTDYGNTETTSYVNCTVEGVTFKVTGKTTVGGFLGCDGYNLWANYGKDCTVTGLVVNCANDDAQYTVGGFMGSNNGANYDKDYAFENCTATGVINAHGNTNTASTFGGFVGFVGGRPASFGNCTADVDIDVAAGDVGGFCGETQQYFAHEYKFEDCEAKGDVTTANGTAGGFIANVQHGGDGNALNVIITGATVSGNVNGTTANALIGNINDDKNGNATGGEVALAGNTVSEGVTVNKETVTEENTVGGNTDIVKKPIEISTVEDLKKFAADVNAGDDFAGKTVVLTADIEVNDYWFNNETGVDYRITKDFAGTFDGNGHSIKGLKFQNTDTTKNPNMYLFSSISGAVKNLTLDGVDADINDRDCFGFIAYKLTGTAEKCHVKNVTVDVAVNANGTGYMYSSGAMFGQIVSAQVDGCTAEHVTFRPTGTDNMDNIGALIGTASGTTDKKSTVKNCSVTDVNYDCTRKTKRTGGFIGSASYTDFTDCTATDVTINVATYYQSIGGFVGNASTNSTYTNCDVTNFKLIIPEDAALAGDVGGFTGYTSSSPETPVKFTNCDVTGLDMDLTCNDNNEWTAGGFIGYVQSNVEVINCTTAGDITVVGECKDHVTGGLIGTLNWTSDKTVDVSGSTSGVNITTNGIAGEFTGEENANGSVIVSGVEDNYEYTGTINAIIITTLGELKAFRDAVNAGNTFEGKTVLLAADIDLNNENWTPIGNSCSTIFSGIFDGQGHTISNLSISAEKGSQALFGHAGGTTIKNLTIHNATVNSTGGSSLAVVVGHGDHGNHVFENIKITGLVKIKGVSGMGTVIGTAPNVGITASNITVDVKEGSIVDSTLNIMEGHPAGRYYSYTGGVFGQVWGAKFTDITSNIDVIGACVGTGGITGGATGTWKNITHTGDVIIAGEKDMGYWYTNKDEDGNAYGIIYFWQGAGLISGYHGGTTFENCVSTGTLTYQADNTNTNEIYYNATVINPESRDTLETVTLCDSRFGSSRWSNDNTITVIDYAELDEDNEPVETYVAYIGNVGYTSIQAAIDAATGDRTEICLCCDVVEKGIKVEASSDNKVIALDLNGYTLYGDIYSEGALEVFGGTIKGTRFVSTIESFGDNAWLKVEQLEVISYRHAIRIEGGSAHIVSGTYQTLGNVNGDSDCHAINAGGSSATSVNISGGTFIGPKGSANTNSADSGSAIQAQAKATVSIYGGTFSGGQINTLNAINGGGITVTGGTYDQDPSAYVAEGFIAKPAETEGWYTVAIDYVAQIGDTKYATLEDAIDAAKDGQTITLLKDVEIEGRIYIARKNITVDLDGKTITNGYFELAKESNVTVKNGTLKVDGSAVDYAIYLNGDKAQVALENVTISGYTYSINGGNGNSITIESGNYDAVVSVQGGTGVTITINGGTFTASGQASLRIRGAQVVVTGGVFNNAVMLEYGSLKIEGGTFYGKVSATNDATKFITGGLFKYEPKAEYIADGYVTKQNSEGMYEVVYAIEWAGKTLMYEDSIEIKYLFTINVSNPVNYGLEVWYKHVNFDTVAADKTYGLDKNGNYWQAVTEGIPAKQMGDKQYVRAYVEIDGVKYYTDVVEYSPAIYAENRYNKTDDPNTKALVIALMNYGAAAQKYFDYDVENLMNAFLKDEEKAIGFENDMIKTLGAVDTAKVESDSEFFKKVQKNLEFEGAINIMVRAQLASSESINLENSKLLYWDAATYAESDSLTAANAKSTAKLELNGLYYVGSIDSIAAKNLGDTGYYCVYIEDAEGNGHYSELFAYSAHEYAKNKIAANTNEKLVELTQAMVVYSVKAGAGVATKNK